LEVLNNEIKCSNNDENWVKVVFDNIMPMNPTWESSLNINVDEIKWINMFIPQKVNLDIIFIYMDPHSKLICWPCLLRQDIVFRFIIKYNSLRDFGPWGNRSIFIWGFLKGDILACVETWD
jgi:hypothetical protein